MGVWDRRRPFPFLPLPVITILIRFIKKGGYTLNKIPSEIKISDILSAVEEKVKTIGCQKHSKKGCNGKSAKCITHNLWDELETHINVFFQEKNLGDLINKTENRL